MTKYTIETKQLTKIYKDQKAVNNVNIHVKKDVFTVYSVVMAPVKPQL